MEAVRKGKGWQNTTAGMHRIDNMRGTKLNEHKLIACGTSPEDHANNEREHQPKRSLWLAGLRMRFALKTRPGRAAQCF